MRVVYCADDGTEFDTEQECRDYELKTADFFAECANVLAYDDCGRKVHFNNFEMENMEDAFQDIWYVQFNTQKAIDLFCEIGQSQYGLLYIKDDIHREIQVGERYYYDGDKDVWRCVEDDLKAINKIADMFNNKKN